MQSKTILHYLLSLILFFITISSSPGCSGCSKSGLKKKSKIINRTTPSTESNKAIIPVASENGVSYIWVSINGIKLRFIFDTGASTINISSVEASILHKNGTLRDEDILNTQYFRDATGRISAGTKINLRTVEIGNRVLNNIEAIVVDNDQAPLLLGQSALEKFGRISIDNRNGVIVFE